MSKVTSLPPIKPKAGDIFVIESINTEDWKCDQYLWIRDGGRTIKIKGVEIGKVFYKVRIPGTEIKSGRVRPRFSLKFKKVGYWLTNRPTLVLVHYIGDETIYTPMAHGNSKHDGEFKRTMPSVIDKLSSHLDGFVKQLTLYPDLVAVVSLPEIITQFNQLLDVKSDEQLYLSYDTTFNLGDCYVSAIVFKHILFKETPLIPLAFVIHDRKFGSVHETLFNFLKFAVPKISKKEFPIVVDREAGIRKAIKNILPDCPILTCWNHLRNDFKYWLNKKVSPDNIRLYHHQLKQMLQCDSENEFLELSKDLTSKWTSEVVSYFEKELKTDILERSGKWVLEQFEAPSDIISYLKTAHVNTPQLSSPSAETTETVENLSDSKTEHSTPTTPKEKDTPVINTMFDFPAFVSSQHALAKYIVDNNLITLVPSQAAFIVQGRNGKYCVTLFPKKTCQCPSTTTCFHILAAKMSIGQEPIEKRPVVSLRVLTKNNRKRVDKKSGKKQPRQNDYDPVVEPAPDSAYLVNTPKTPSQVHSTQKSPQKSALKTKSKTPHSKKKLHFNLETVSEEEIDTCPISPDEKKDNIITLDDTPPGKKRKLDFPSPPISIEIEQEKNNHG
ncbi:unnamed protein product [Mytilus edulis]|uniref:SWIM-type domain-containing protein n=1 Tax=Mytilus edulis TaxID=6550 RepID=A0A8S3U276_MYTED|nr:unnamed protein product [Mytilus edulis]